MENSLSKTILNVSEEDGDSRGLRPTLFVCHGHSITEYRLEGRQSLGRPAGDYTPDIPVQVRFISRDHGYFETGGNETSYTASKTTNPIRFRGKVIEPGTGLKLKDGDELIIPWTDKDGKDRSIILVYALTRSRINLWRELRRASRDDLTGLSSREAFENWWKQNRDKRDYARAVLFILDVDDFKKLNDSAGHNAGDMALRLISRELKHSVRYEEQLCRWGGDEFIGIIPAVGSEAASRLDTLAGAIREATKEAGIPVSVSIGYTDIHDAGDGRDIASLVELADKALYHVKQSDKNGISEYGNVSEQR